MIGRRHTPTRGSVLMLMPAAVLIVLLLGAIAVDSAIVFLAQRQAYNVAFDAANDVAGAGFDAATARETGEIVYDPSRVEDLARESVAASSIDGLEFVGATVVGDVVEVTVAVEADRLFTPAFGGDNEERLTMTARAEGLITTPG